MAEKAGEKKKATFICARNTLEGVYPPLILALQAVRAGAETSLFFTFDGINAVRKGGIKKAKYFPPGLLGVIPGIPALATRMMVRMAEENAGIPRPEDLLEMCQLEGVKLYACQMTVDMMKLRPEEFLPGVEIIDAPGYMKLALAADINIFV
ncbi:DsrE/DsrF/DrsH-like family protein [Desulfothermobacter acidiphilus]|uniref:DsrE/DsrF/DrsH-like family protein n=1 Tax=Desulfothermobacter acidiphilus TaxID=1938353 RepID=UPI003F8C58B1